MNGGIRIGIDMRIEIMLIIVLIVLSSIDAVLINANIGSIITLVIIVTSIDIIEMTIIEVIDTEFVEFIGIEVAVINIIDSLNQNSLSL